jgi:hypothetical protein
VKGLAPSNVKGNSICKREISSLPFLLAQRVSG